MTTTAPPACERRWRAGGCLTGDLPPQPVTEPHECRQPAGHPPPCRCHWCGTTTTGCPCWHAPVSLHDGHCCFRHPTHDYRSDVPLPCGHDHREESHA